MTTPKKRKGDGRVAFLAHADTFKKLLDAGHTQRAIYDDHPAAIANTISYAQFNRYVGKYLLKKETPARKPNQPQPPAKKPVPTKPGTGFLWRPNYDRDDLI